MLSFYNRPRRKDLADAGYWSLDAGCRRAGHCARLHARRFAVGTARGASACAARDRPHDIGASNPLFVQNLESSI